MLYAIGEIALVVIGILIALQINNRNERKKAGAIELMMLTEIQKSLCRDTAYFHMLTGRLTRIDTSSERIINLIIDNVKNDSLLFHHMSNLRWPYTFMYEDGAFEALKASGIEKVSDDSLRNHLISHYGFEMPRWVKLMQLYHKDSDIKLAEDLEWDLFSYEPDMSNGQRGWIENFGLKPDMIGSDKFFRNIRIKQQDASNGLRFLKEIIRNSKSLLVQLNEELDSAEME